MTAHPYRRSTLWLAGAAATMALLCPLTSAQADRAPLAPAELAQFEAALQPLGLNTEDLSISPEEIGLWGGDKYKLNLIDFLRADALRCGPYARSTSGALLANKDKLGSLVTGAHSRLDNGIRLGLVDDPLAAHKARIDSLGETALATALSELSGRTVESYVNDPAYRAVPLPMQKAAALVLFTVPEAQRDREQGLIKPLQALGLDPAATAQRVFNFTVNTFAEEDDTTGHEVIDDRADAALVESLLDHVDWNYINRSSTLLALATQDAYNMLIPPPPPDPAAPPAAADAPAPPAPLDLSGLATEFNFQVDTPLGLVRLSGSAMDEYPQTACLLSIDSGGTDIYALAGAADIAHPVSINIDCGSNEDHYAALDADAAGCASGIFGTGILLDAGGDDTYSSGWGGEGGGIFGTGVLYDLGGNDRYSASGYGQGSGTYGAGILADLGGDDEYTIYKYGQAYGGTRGCGILLDVAGDDQYLANMEDHFNGGLYGPTHHVHFVQGSAYGRRADITDGHSWAGGFGLLCDGAGDDQYVSDCYGQGNAYWHCCGMLVDKSGDDVYRAGQYSQASAPHFACGILQDDAGDDRYIISIRQSMAHGRDFSLAWLEDSAGDDWYQGARTTLGVSHVNSISVFWDKLGNDTYIMKGPGLGDSEPEPNGSPRDWLLSLGLFIDGAGQDGYYLLPGDESYEGSNTFSGEITEEQLAGLTRLDFAGDGKSWQRTPAPDGAPGYLGCGVDLPVIAW